MKVCVLGNVPQYVQMFEALGFTTVDAIDKEPDFVCFTGGADVSPSLYDEEKHPTTHNDPHRDDYEVEVFKYCLELGIKMVGICRGGQFLHVMNGGKLYQDVSGHAMGQTHNAIDMQSGSVYSVTSTHHQMMRYNGSGKLLAIAIQGGYKQSLEPEYDGKNDPYINVDPEAIWHKETMCLCFQPHPEFTRGIGGTRKLFKNYLGQYIKD